MEQLNQMLCLSDVFVYHPQIGKLKNSCCLKKKMNLFIDRAALSLSDYMEVTKFIIFP